eukprot:76701-Prymnesium_polylepis.1
MLSQLRSCSPPRVTAYACEIVDSPPNCHTYHMIAQHSPTAQGSAHLPEARAPLVPPHHPAPPSPPATQSVRGVCAWQVREILIVAGFLVGRCRRMRAVYIRHQSISARRLRAQARRTAPASTKTRPAAEVAVAVLVQRADSVAAASAEGVACSPAGPASQPCVRLASNSRLSCLATMR